MTNTPDGNEQELANLKLNTWLSIVNSRRHRDVSFDNYIPHNKEQQKAILTCREWAKDLPETHDRGLFLVGPVGTGKTHLLLATIRQLIELYPQNIVTAGVKHRYWRDGSKRTESAISVTFVSMIDLLRDIKDSFGQEERDKNLGIERISKDARSCDLLFIDDIAAERTTDWVREQIFDLIDYRYRYERLTSFTSNLNASELEAVLGDRTMSRIMEMTTGVPVVGPDFRKSVNNPAD
jgi:DNA replication protein DnaC